jgi:hypothetical protein
MGKHFDDLVDLIKQEIPQSIHSSVKLDARKYLTDIVNRFALFEFPLKKEEILPNSGMERAEYQRYLIDYFKMSQEAGKFLVTPFNHTAIEDPVSVVFLDPLGGSRYRLTSFAGKLPELPHLSGSIWIANVNIFTPNLDLEGVGINPDLLYLSTCNNGGYVELIPQRLTAEEYYEIGKDITNAAMAFIQENIYLMDPENFIIRMDSHASLKEDRKRSAHPQRDRKPRKTVMRPHYVSLSQKDAILHIRNESVEPRPIHIVRGHWKRLMSERYKASKGKVLQIEQYNRGKGVFEGRNGIRYSVYIKEDFGTLRQPTE